LLYTLATQVPINGKIIEVGSYQARSTIALALGAKVAGAKVWAIDHHPTYEIMGTSFGMGDNAAYYANLTKWGVGDVVRTINLPSSQTFICWIDPVDLVWIDGDHEYEQVRQDWYMWSSFTDKVALHDTAGHHVGLNRLVQEIVMGGNWIADQVVDSMTVFKNIAKELS